MGVRKELRIGVVTSDPTGWHSSRLLDAAGEIGRAEALSPLDVSVHVDAQGAEVWFGNEQASRFNALLLRGLDNEGLPDFQLEAYRLMEESVPVTINRVGPVLTALDKCRSSFMLHKAGLPTPDTVVTQRPEVAVRAVREFGVAVLKPLYGSLGEDIVRVTPGREASDVIARMLRDFGVIYVQRFLGPGGRDIRAFVIGGRVVAAIYRVAREGEWITNVFQGARSERANLSPSMAALAVGAARAVDLDYTGVDIIEGPDGPAVIEVNGTPSWMGVEEAWNLNIAREIVGLAARRVRRAALATYWRTA